MLFGEKILDYKDEMFKDLNTLLSFESIDGEKTEECEKALEFMLKKAESFGLVSEQVTDTSAHVQLGEGGKLCQGVLLQAE